MNDLEKRDILGNLYKKEEENLFLFIKSLIRTIKKVQKKSLYKKKGHFYSN